MAAKGILGRKLGMTQIWDDQNRVVPVTVIEAGPCVVTQIRNEQRDGYVALQVGYGAVKRLNKPMRGHMKRLGDFRHLREFRVDDPESHKLGDRIGAELVQEGDLVDITAKSKGRGFAGVVKRHHFAGGPKTHGQSDRHRAPGAIGAGNTPGRTFKGLRGPGHMGAEQVTVRNVEVLQLNLARGLIIIAGSVPGPREGLVKIRLSKRTLEAARSGKRKITEPVAEKEPEAEEAPAAEEPEVNAAALVDEGTPESDAEAPGAEATEGEAAE